MKNPFEPLVMWIMMVLMFGFGTFVIVTRWDSPLTFNQPQPAPTTQPAEKFGTEEWCQKRIKKYDAEPRKLSEEIAREKQIEMFKLLAAIEVEEGWRGEDVPGKDGERGPYQVTPIWWEDVNRIMGEEVSFTPKHYLNKTLVEARMVVCWHHYGAKTAYSRAALHHGGPNWKAKPLSRAYGQRVINLMKVEKK